MCGIAGIILKPNRSLPDLESRLVAMADAMAHRGPDDEGTYVSPDQRIGIANRRLAIRDLSPAAHMPMSNHESSIWITYNGEVYNAGELRTELEDLGYGFRSQSDTEIVLHGYQAWGAEVVHRLRGMFAFAILDRRPSATSTTGHLFLARDRLGIKPLYYAETPQVFVFASELKGMRASGLAGREISPAGLAGYLLMGSVPNPWTICDGVQGLEPACCLTIALDDPAPAEARTYWHLPTDSAPLPKTEDAVDEVRELLAEVVRIRLVSDVPLGAFLSGGLDSSSVVTLMRQATEGPIRTCSMVFEEAEYSEAPYARAVAEAVGAEHYERVVTADDLLAEFDAVLAAMDQPSVDGVNTYFVSQTARQAGLTVALSGLGGDELFGGYTNTFRGVPQMHRVLRLVHAVPGGPALARAAIDRLPDRRRWAKVHDALSRPPSPASAYLARRGLFAPSEVQALLHPEIWREACRAFDPIGHIAARAGETSAGPDMAWVSRAELRTYTHHQLLRDTDAMSMAHSLEVRVPLLDERLVEAVLRLPAAAKKNGAPGPKPLLAHALGEALPAEVRERRGKQGFTFPFAPWLHGRLKGRVEAALGAVQAAGLLRAEAAAGILADYQAGMVHWSRPWALVALGAAL